MHGRRIAGWLQLIGVAGGSLGLIAGAYIVSLAASSDGMSSTVGRAPVPESSAVLSRDADAAQPSLLEILQSAQALAKAGKLPQTEQPSLIEILRSAEVLAKAGKLSQSEQPSLLEILRSAEALVGAGLLPAPPQPSLLEILQSAQVLADAGGLPAQAEQASLLEILTAVNELSGAGALPGEQAKAPPPQAPVEPPAAPDGNASGWYDDGYSARVGDLVNAERARAGLAPVSVDERLVRAAGGYAQVLAANNWFSHTGPDGSTFVSRIEAAGFPFTVQFGEIIAWGTESWPAESLVQMWMNSPTHREEILSPAYTRAGARCYFTPAEGVTVRCVMDFAG